MSDMITVSHLSKRYGSATALHDVSFTVKKGEVIGFLGPNGAGKTTTMRIITGYIPQTSGKVTIAGMDIQDEPLETKKRIGYLPENVPLYRDMTVDAYLQFTGELKGLKGATLEKHIVKAIDACNLQKVHKKVIDTLSKGYRQRVGLAQALIGDPDVLILDEPTVGLDPTQIIEIRSLIKKLGEERTVILSTHILPEVSQTCSRVIIINGGKIVASGTPEELTSKVNKESHITLHVGGDAVDALESLLGKVSNDITNVSIESVGNDQLKASFAISSKEELRPKIAEAVVKSKEFSLLGLQEEVLGLEEVFLQVTKQ